jgi:asparagine synthase (glutamine-hydrolysing)
VFRYIALFYDKEDPAARASATSISAAVAAGDRRWVSTVESPELHLFQSDARPPASKVVSLNDGRCSIIGVLFRRSSEPFERPVSTLSENDTSEVTATAARCLVARYWGRYVAILWNSATRRIMLLRDPTGGLPCMYVFLGGVTIVFSHASDVSKLLLHRFTINWNYVATHVAFWRAKTSETGIREINEVRPGECVEFSIDGKVVRRELYWWPAQFARDGVIDDACEATKQLRRTTQHCIWTWASCYSGIVHNLSGGLDSSIVASCLRSAPTAPRVTCLTYFSSKAPASDERRFARAMARAARCKLVESEEVSNTRLDVVKKVDRFATPAYCLHAARHSRYEYELARLEGANSIFLGAAGDQIFYHGPLLSSVADHLQAHWFARPALRTALYVALRERRSVWSVIAAGVKEAARSRQTGHALSIGSRSRLVSDAAARNANEQVRSIVPPAKGCAGLPPGKIKHAVSVAIDPGFYSPLEGDDDPERVLPLVSQPLIELCMRIPTYVLTDGGTDRALARKAFSPDLPPEICARTSKGAIDEYVSTLFQHNIPFLRDFILGGELIARGYLDSRRVEGILSGARGAYGIEVSELLADHLSTEAWLRSWI